MASANIALRRKGTPLDRGINEFSVINETKCTNKSQREISKYDASLGNAYRQMSLTRE